MPDQFAKELILTKMKKSFIEEAKLIILHEIYTQPERQLVKHLTQNFFEYKHTAFLDYWCLSSAAQRERQL